MEKDTQNPDDIGFCDRTLGKCIPKCRTPEGAAIRGRLQRSGLVRSSGHELFRGCIVFPTVEDGHIVSATSFSNAKSKAKKKVYFDRHISFYYGCDYVFDDIGSTVVIL